MGNHRSATFCSGDLACVALRGSARNRREARNGRYIEFLSCSISNERYMFHPATNHCADVFVAVRLCYAAWA